MGYSGLILCYQIQNGENVGHAHDYFHWTFRTERKLTLPNDQRFHRGGNFSSPLYFQKFIVQLVIISFFSQAEMSTKYFFCL